MTIPLITVDNIAVRLRDRWLLEGSTWRINTGELWAVIGPNGAGKTTLVKAVAGLLPVVQGKIHYHDFAAIAPHDAIAYVASDTRRDLWRRESQLEHARHFAGRFDDRTTVSGWLGLQPNDPASTASGPPIPTDVVWHFRLNHLMDKPLMALSTGEMSRLLVARALIRRPRMLILDEPFDGLDRGGRRELVAMLDRLADSGLTMVLITHRSDEILPATSHVMTIDGGRIVHSGPVGQSLPALLDAAAKAPKVPAIRPADDASMASDGDRLPPRTLPLIEMQAVTVRYGDTIVLDGLTWTVAADQNWAISGPNGSGKSTVLKLITGDCLQVYANRIRLFGQDRGTDQTLADVRRRIGVVSHDLAAAYQKNLSALDVVCSGFFDSVGLYRRCDPLQAVIAGQWLTTLGIADLGRTPFNQLSQGQRQMVLIARAMVKSPRLLILDEPCAGLDSGNRQRVLDAVTRIGRQETTGLIFVSHHAAEIPDCTTHRLVLDRGRALDCGPVRHP